MVGTPAPSALLRVMRILSGREYCKFIAETVPASRGGVEESGGVRRSQEESGGGEESGEGVNAAIF